MVLSVRPMPQANATFWIHKLRIGAMLLGLAGAFGLFAPASAQQKLYGAEARSYYAEPLRAISRYMAQLRQLSGQFVQINPSGDIFAGKFYLSRPGRMRFAYTVPNGMIVVADGEFVHIREAASRPIESYPLSASPLGLFLHYDIDLSQNDALQAVEMLGTQLHVYLRDPNQALPGYLVLQFDYPLLRLTGWRVLDGRNKEIQIRLQDVQSETALANRLFTLR